MSKAAVEIDVHRVTTEAVWQSWAALPALPPLRLSSGEPSQPVVVVAPHPDDEVLGVGGLMRGLHAHGHPLHVVAVTDGDASHPGSGAVTPAALAAARIAESHMALERLALHDVPVIRFGLPDGDVAEREVAARLEAVVETLSVDGPALLLAPWRADGHPDHDACGSAAAAVAATMGARLLEYLVWTWSWARPGDPRVPWGRAQRFALDSKAEAAKAAAIGAFRSQTTSLGPAPEDGPVLPAGVLAHHGRSFEVVLT